jgi:DNA-binding GntR family transcriptional regulator
MVIIKKTVAQKAYEKIKKMIINQEILPGTPIVEVNFAKKLNMSRTPIRVAIRHLQEDGLVELVSNKGAFVKILSKNDIILSFEMLEALEGMAAYLVAEKYKLRNLLKSDLDNLEKLAIKMDKDLETINFNNWSKCDREFHNEIAKLCGNYYISNQHVILKIQMNCALWFITPVYVDKKASNKEHHMILEAILSKDPDKARQIAQNHRNRARKEIIKTYNFLS